MAIYLLNSIICPFYNWMLEFMLGGLYCALLLTAFMQMSAEVRRWSALSVRGTHCVILRKVGSISVSGQLPTSTPPLTQQQSIDNKLRLMSG